MQHNAQRTKQGAFTLIELLVVIVILGILAALILLVGSKMVERSQTAGCVTSMRQVYMALMAYRADNDGWFPGKQRYYRRVPIDIASYGGIMKSALIGENYLHDTKPFIPAGYLNEMPICPAAHLQPAARAKYPDEKRHIKQLGCYGINGYVLNNKLDVLASVFAFRARDFPAGKHNYPGDSKVVMLAEATTFGAIFAKEHLQSVLDGHSYYGTAPRDHGNHRLNFIFADGHIELLGPKAEKKEDGTYDWDDHFDPWAQDGKSVGVMFMPDSLAPK